MAGALNVESPRRRPRVLQVYSVATSRPNSKDKNASSPLTSPTQIEKVSLVKLAPFRERTGTETSVLSPNTLENVITEEKTQSVQAVEKFEQSSTKQRNLQKASAFTGDVMHSTPHVKNLFPAGSNFQKDDFGEKNRNSTYQSKHKKSDTDNDTGVDSDLESDPGMENPRVDTSGVVFSDSSFTSRIFSPTRKTTSRSFPMYAKHDDELLMYLEIIERRALAVESLIERAKLDTILNVRKQIEAEFNGVSIERIPAKCHQKIDRAIQKYLELELNKIRAEYENKGTAAGSSDKPGKMGWVEKPERANPGDELGELERENGNLRDKIESLETSINRVDMLYLMQKRENEYLGEKVSKLERQLTNEKLKYENDLDDVKSDFAESRRRSSGGFSREITPQLFKTTSASDSESLQMLRQKLEQQEKQNKSLKLASDTDQTTIRCLESKVGELEKELSSSRQEVNELLQEIRDLQGHAERRERKLREREAQLKEVIDERRVLKETVIMSEHEISLLENKLGNEVNDAWKDSKKEILEELWKLEKHINVIHKEKRKLENKYLAFKIENENLSDSLHSFGKTKDILTPLVVSRDQSTLSSHSSSLSSSLAGSDVEDEEVSHHASRGKTAHGSARKRRRNAQDQKDKKFAEAVARKLVFAQQALKDQNCNFSTFENSGEDLINEADQLVKRVDSLQAEKRAIKMELESIRSMQPETDVKC